MAEFLPSSLSFFSKYLGMRLLFCFSRFFFFIVHFLFLVIKKPIDLQRIRQKIGANQYATQKAFFADVKLVFDNACRVSWTLSLVFTFFSSAAV